MTWLGWLPWKHKLDGLPPRVVWFSLVVPPSARCSLPPSGCRPEVLSSCLQSLLSLLLGCPAPKFPGVFTSLRPPEQAVTGSPVFELLGYMASIPVVPVR